MLVFQCPWLQQAIGINSVDTDEPHKPHPLVLRNWSSLSDQHLGLNSLVSMEVDDETPSNVGMSGGMDEVERLPKYFSVGGSGLSILTDTAEPQTPDKSLTVSGPALVHKKASPKSKYIPISFGQYFVY